MGIPIVGGQLKGVSPYYSKAPPTIRHGQLALRGGIGGVKGVDSRWQEEEAAGTIVVSQSVS